MGSRSKARARAQASAASDGARQGRPPIASVASDERRQSPPTVVGAAAVQAIQSAAILLASILAGFSAISGKAYENASGIAITVIGFGTAILLGYVAFGLAKAKRWSRTPALLTQLFTGIVGIYLVQGHRWSWGIPALLLCVAGFALILAPPSIRALTVGKDDAGALAR